jgi:diadenosine tetraphosphatase ApaH/serine/threonine PP2A family protein phosphatase
VRYAIFSDVHGNLQALQSVLERMDELRVDRRICLGDIVGYGGDPGACIRTIRQSGAQCVAGNHDCAVLGTADLDSFNSQARAAVLWTRTVLGEDDCAFLSDLPPVIREDDTLFVHASPHEPDRWHYVFTRDQADRALESFEETVCVIGHTHRPLAAARRAAEPCRLSVPGEIRIDPDIRYVINAGSVGQPRDGDPDACFLLMDRDEGTARIERVPYDIEGAERAIRNAGLPPHLAQRLRDGR